MIEIQTDSRSHLKTEKRWPGRHHLHLRTFLEQITYFRAIFDQKNLKNNCVHTNLSVNCILNRKVIESLKRNENLQK